MLTLLNASGWSAPEIVQLISDEPFEFIVIPVLYDCTKLNVVPLETNAPLTTRLAPEEKFSVVPEVSVSVAPEFIVSEPANVYVPACNVAFEATTE